MSSNSSSDSIVVDPNTAGLPDQRPLILALGIVFIVLATACTAARFYARKIKAVGLGADDWTCLVALILCICVCIDVMLDAMLGNLGWHTLFDDEGFPIDLNTYLAFGKSTFALEVIVWPAVGLTKISVLLLYKRIFGISNVFRILIWIMISLVITWTISFTFALTFACLPLDSNWDPTVASTCVNQQVLFTIALATDVVTDGMILLLPAYNVWKLHMPIMRKISIIGIFMLGGLVTVTGIIRIHYVTLVYNDLSEPTFDDISYVFAPPYYWSIIESCTGIVCACLPTMMPLVEKYRINTIGTRLLSTFGRSSSSRFRRSKDDDSKGNYKGLPPRKRSHGSGNHFWHSFFTTSSRNDGSSLASSTQLTDMRSPKVES